MQKISIHDEKKVKELLESNGEKAFRYSQIENAIYKNFITNFDDMNTLSKNVREILKENCFFYSLSVDNQKTSSNGQTTKILFKTETGEFIEAVIMRHLTGRVTLCVSCQAGCPMGCTFCATGKLGLLRNLKNYEIIEQIYYAAKLLNDEGDKLRNIVYMGMGEPMLNYEVVKETINIANNQKKFDLANRRVTVSTCGIVPGIKKFTNDFPQTSLAISLHAPNDEIRKQIMPVDHTYPLSELMKSLDEYTAKTNKRIFYEYIMINGVNDNIKLAHELGKLLEGKLAHVNFIPYNAGEGTGGTYSPTPRFIIEKFQTILQHYGVVSTIRATMGDDIDAACGQLANKKKDLDNK
ncbi:MAG: 23S rRNA (adenine(2503)-C(2))-methyltransferase RlmN [Candidatus Gracilibacteria bacterium]|nr:23S rRNA (adenine(2503)-C(2))-methyltransferase RlmN [Candidatus Gracilibacteria bacterium]